MIDCISISKYFLCGEPGLETNAIEIRVLRNLGQTISPIPIHGGFIGLAGSAQCGMVCIDSCCQFMLILSIGLIVIGNARVNDSMCDLILS